MSISKLYFAVTIIALAAGIVLPIIPLVVMRAGRTDALTGLAWVAVAFGLAGYIAALAIERGKSRGFMLSGLATGLAAFVIWAWSVIFSPRMSEVMTIMWIAVPLTGWTMQMSFSGILEMLPVRQGWGAAVRSATHVLAGILTFFWVVVICYLPVVDQWERWEDRNSFQEISSRCGGVLAILAASGTLVLVVASLLPRVSRDEVPRSERREFTIVCPRCAARQQILTDGAACTACGLRIKVTPT